MTGLKIKARKATPAIRNSSDTRLSCGVRSVNSVRWSIVFVLPRSDDNESVKPPVTQGFDCRSPRPIGSSFVFDGNQSSPRRTLDRPYGSR
jgi:hypothetical protein